MHDVEVVRQSSEPAKPPVLDIDQQLAKVLKLQQEEAVALREMGETWSSLFLRKPVLAHADYAFIMLSRHRIDLEDVTIRRFKRKRYVDVFVARLTAPWLTMQTLLHMPAGTPFAGEVILTMTPSGDDYELAKPNLAWQRHMRMDLHRSSSREVSLLNVQLCGKLDGPVDIGNHVPIASYDAVQEVRRQVLSSMEVQLQYWRQGRSSLKGPPVG